jgi:hypothetical protein
VHSRRALAAQRSANEFARGARGGVLTIAMPACVRTASNGAVICAVPADGAEFRDGFGALRSPLAEVAGIRPPDLVSVWVFAALSCRRSVLPYSYWVPSLPAPVC